MNKLNKHSFNNTKKGMGTVEVVIIIAILVALALTFRSALTKYASAVMGHVFDEEKVIGQI
ncbi:MAG: hypothetical protein J5752_10015 [Clostridiales bacterium]|nr:hypothetical protein [Clostridiales bacterium]